MQSFSRGKALSTTHTERTYATLITQHAKRMRRIVSLSAASLAQPHFSTLSHKRIEFQK